MKLERRARSLAILDRRNIDERGRSRFQLSLSLSLSLSLVPSLLSSFSFSLSGEAHHVAASGKVSQSLFSFSMLFGNKKTHKITKKGKKKKKKKKKKTNKRKL